MIVTKFGGTSVESAEAIDRVVGIVRGAADRRPLVVLSACAGVTNALLAMARDAREGRLAEVETSLLKLRERHLGIARDLLRSPAYDLLARALESSTHALRAFLQAVTVMRDLTGRAQDYVVSFGEQWSTAIFLGALRQAGQPASLVDARELLVTDNHFTAAVPQLDLTRQRLLTTIPPLVARGQVVVTQGFVGASVEGITTTIGRGGSDYSAAIFAAMLEARELQIWTDVDGVLTADPSLIPTATNIPEMTFDEASELAYFGARVLHPSTILPAVEKDIPVRVLNSRKPDHPGTVIRRRVDGPRKRIVQSIAYKEGVSLLTIRSNRTMIAPAFISHVFAVFGTHHKVIDTIVTSETGISLTVRDRDHMEEIVAALEKVGTVQWQPGRAVVTVVGEGLRQSVSARSGVFDTLRRTGVAVELVSLGGSDISITFVIQEADIAGTVTALHQEFFERTAT